MTARRSHRDPSAPSRWRWLDRETVAIILVYTAAWGLLLGAAGRYWDDWSALDMTARAAADLMRQQVHPWQASFLRALSALPGTERIGHLMTFGCYLVAALALNRLLRAAPATAGPSRVMVPALFAVFPVNAARWALIDLMYAISLAVFMVGWWLIAADFETPRLWRRATAGGLLIFAMVSTGSLLMFVAAVPLYVVLVRAKDFTERESRSRLAVRYGFLLALPIVAFLLLSLMPNPSGLYQGYNQVTAAGMRDAIADIVPTFDASVIQPARGALSGPPLAFLLVGVLLYAALLAVMTIGRRPAVVRSKAPWWYEIALLGVGVMVFFLGVFPYLAVGKLPRSVAWHSRHQLLVPFAAALLIYGVVSLAFRLLRLDSRAVVLVLCVLLSAFVLEDVRTSLAFQTDWYKQVSLMQQMGKSADMRRGGYFVFTDNTSALNVFGRTYRFYEYNGMMRHVFGDATRFGVNLSQAAEVDPQKWTKHEQYNCWEYVPTSDRYLVTISKGRANAERPRAVLGLMWREAFAHRLFERTVNDVVRIQARPIP